VELEQHRAAQARRAAATSADSTLLTPAAAPDPGSVPVLTDRVTLFADAEL
jgi:hypothetical protein